MINSLRNSRWIVLAVVVLLGGGIVTWTIAALNKRSNAPSAQAAEKNGEHESELHDAQISVKVVHPKKGLLQRLSTQPGSIQAYESVRLFAKVPGFLKWQRVARGRDEKLLDIGEKVKKGQKLAVVDVPELESQVRRNTAALKQTRAKVDQMKARVASAEADLLAAKAAVTRAEASAKSAAAWVRFRRLQQQRMEYLFALKSIEEKLVDEAKEHYEASFETELAAKETVTANKAKVISAHAKIEQAKADVEEAKAEIDVAQAELEKAQVQVAFATITAPFDGVVTQRSFFEGDYIRSANEGSNLPVLTVDRTDLMRVIVQMPDRDVPFTDPGDDAFVQIDALPGRKLPAKVSRIASYEDPQTRLMRVELDLPNPTGKIFQGMYGQVTIVLDQEKDLVSLPTSCLTSRGESGKATVFVVRDGIVHQVSVRLGTDNGLRVAVLTGVTQDDQVILNPSSAITDGAEVNPIE